MSIIEIKRIETSEDGTIGVLSIDKSVVGFTIEPPWRMNERNVSCIPTGSYFYKVYDSPKFGRKCISLYNVHGRDYVAMHPGNTVKDTKACILPGISIDHVLRNCKKAVTSSGFCLDYIIANSDKAGWIVITENY